MKIQIVIPVYNDPIRPLRMIHHCYRQMKAVNDNPDLPDMAMMVVNDRSTDETEASLAAEIGAINDPAIQIISTDRRRFCGGARNAGVDATESDYIMFFDADDDLAPLALETIARTIAKNESDMVMWGLQKLTRKGTEVFTPSFKDPTVEFPTAPIGVWLKAVKRSIFVRFEEGRYCEDCVWWFLQADKVNTLSVIPSPLYIYDRRGECFSRTTERFAYEPHTLEDLAFNDVIVKAGGNDRAPSDCLRNMADMYDVRKSLKNPNVRNAWATRFHNDFVALVTGRLSF